jgi:hypothetical protein
MVEIIIKGYLDEKWINWFDGIDITHNGDNTILSGTLKDDTHLHGILDRIRDLNLKLVSVNPVDDNTDFNKEMEKK